MGNKSDLRFEELGQIETHTPNAKSGPLLCSTRIRLFVIFLMCTLNFVIQRFNVNFAVVCMHRPYLTEVTRQLSHEELLELMKRLDEEGVSVEMEYEDDFNQSTTIAPPEILQAGSCKEAVRVEKQGDADPNTDYHSEFVWSKETQAGIIAAFYYGHTFAQIPGGWIVDRFGAKTALIWSQLLLSILSLLNPAAAKIGPQVMFVVRMFQGVANAATMPAIGVLVTRWCGVMEQSFLIGISYAGIGIGTAIVYPVSAFLCERFGWQFIFFLPGSLGVLWCVGAYFMVYNWPETHPRISKRELQFLQKNRTVHYYGDEKGQRVKTPWVKMLTSSAVFAHIVTNFCCFWSFLMLSSFLPSYMNDVMQVDITKNGLYSSLPYVGMISFHFVVAILFDFLRKKQICSVNFLRKSFNTIGMTFSAVSLILLGMIPCDSVIGTLTLFTISQTMLELWMGTPSWYTSAFTATTHTVAFMGGFLGPAVVSWMTPDKTRDQWLNVFYLTAGINLFGMFFYLFFGSNTLQSWAMEPQVNRNGASVSKNNAVDVLQGQELKLLQQEKKELNVENCTDHANDKNDLK